MTADIHNEACDLKVFLLVGGMGTRLRSIVSSVPKPLARVGANSFLELLIRQLKTQGFRQIVMCTGYLAEQVELEFGDGSRWDSSIAYSVEETPLGTAGAVSLAAERYLDDDSDFIVMNGDSFLELNLGELCQFHKQQKRLVSMAAVHVEDSGRYGTLLLNENSEVTAFLEKTAQEIPGVINAGIYVFNRAVLEYIPRGRCSLEQDIFPRLPNGEILAVQQHGLFLDIGTPEDYARAQELCDSLQRSAASRPTFAAASNRREGR